MRAAPQESADPQISVAHAVGIGRKPEAIRNALIKQRKPGIERQAFIGEAVAGEQRLYAGRVAGVGLAGRQKGGSAVNVARIAVALAVEQLETGHLVRR